MRRATFICCLLLAGCGPRSSFRDYSTPVHAVHSFVEAGRVGDISSLRSAIVQDERDGNVACDWRDLGPYELRILRTDGEGAATVGLRTGTIETPIACRKESDGWKVSLVGTLARMQRPTRAPGATPAAPR